jgi:hypothetical protein
MNDQIAALQDTERDSLSRIETRTKKLMQADPRLSYAAAYARAVEQMPKSYTRYCDARGALAKLRVGPLAHSEG